MALLIGSTSGRLVHAQTVEPTAAEQAEGARRAHDLGRLDEAIAGYARAYQISGDASLLFNLGGVQREAGRDAEALRTFQTYLRRDAEALHRESAERQIKELEQKMRAKPATVPGVAIPPPAPPAPRASGPAPVAPAPRASGPAPAAPAPRASGPAPAAPAPASSPPVVRPPAPASSLPPAAARPTSPVPTAPLTTVAPTSWPAQLSLPPASPVPPPSSMVDFSPGTAAGVDLTTQSQPPKSSEGPPLPRWVPWAGAVATVALGTVAIVSGLSASRRFDELKNSCGQTPDGCAADQVSDLRSRARSVSVLWALAGAAAVGTGITIYVNTSTAGFSGLWAF